MFTPGDLILDHTYRIEAELGRGAFGVVYRVTHVELRVERAVKLLRGDADGVGSTVFSDYRNRFKLEAQLAARLTHPNVIQVHDFQEHAGVLYCVMEYAPGGSLADLLAKRGPQRVDRVVGILLDAAAGLEAMHDQLDAVHRDVKPANILLDKQGRAKVADLGLAQVSGLGMSQRSGFGSQAQPHPGTPNYAAPDHQNGSEPLGPTADVYGLGCAAFELLTGQVWKSARRKVSRVGELRADVPGWLDDVVMRMVAQEPGLTKADAANPAKRYVDMGALQVALRKGEEQVRQAPVDPARALVAAAAKPHQDAVTRAAEEKRKADKAGPVRAAKPAPPPVAAAEKPRPQTRRSSKRLAAIFALLILGAGALFWSVYGASQPPKTTTTAPIDGTDPSATVAAAMPTPTNTAAPPTLKPTNTLAPPGPTNTAASPTLKPTNTLAPPTPKTADNTALPTPAPPAPTPTPVPALDPARLAYTYGNVRDSDIHIYDPASGADWAVADQSCDEAEPGWAPGDQIVVFQSNCSGNYELYAVDVDQGGQRQLTTTTCDDREADVSPDGQRLAYRTNCAAGAYSVDGELSIMNLDSGDSYPLGINGRGPAWSPDGSRLAFMSERGNGWEIFVYDFGSGGEYQMTNCRENCRFPAWSPDGRWLSYHTTTGPETTDADTVWKMPSSGGAPSMVVTGSNAGRASWSSNGLVAFNSQQGIEVVDADGGGRQVLLANDSHWAPAWSR